jgi:hypothetical protein
MTSARTFGTGCAGAVLVLVACTPAVHAFNLDGAWAGAVKCQEKMSATRTQRITLEGVLQISQDGTGFGMRFTDGQIIRSYAGMAVFDRRKPAILGDVVFTACGTNDAPAEAGFDEIGTFRVLADLARGRGLLKGTSTVAEDGTTIRLCRWRFKWTSTLDPQVPTTCS